MVIGHVAFQLLDIVSIAVLAASSGSRSAVDKETASTVIAKTVQQTFVMAVADATRSIIAALAALRADHADRELASRAQVAAAVSIENGSVSCFVAIAVARYSYNTVQYLMGRVSGGGPGGVGRGTARKASTIARSVNALIEGQLLAATASALLDSANVFADAALSDRARGMACNNMRMALERVAHMLYQALLLEQILKSECGHVGVRLAAGMAAIMQHDAVRRLQVALLDQLAAEAGMAAELGEGAQQQQQQGEEGRQQEGKEGRQQQQQQEEDAAQQQQQQVVQVGEEQAGDWTVSSGRWWFAVEEARQGQLLGVKGDDGRRTEGVPARGRTAGWLEDYHCHVVSLALGLLLCREQQHAEPTTEGVSARPPPLLLARLAARAAEALCRLCRGQGLGGAYAPAPEWEFCRAQVSGTVHTAVGVMVLTCQVDFNTSKFFQYKQMAVL